MGVAGGVLLSPVSLRLQDPKPLLPPIPERTHQNLSHQVRGHLKAIPVIKISCQTHPHPALSYSASSLLFRQISLAILLVQPIDPFADPFFIKRCIHPGLQLLFCGIISKWLRPVGHPEHILLRLPFS